MAQRRNVIEPNITYNIYVSTQMVSFFKLSSLPSYKLGSKWQCFHMSEWHKGNSIAGEPQKMCRKTNLVWYECNGPS